MKTSLLGILGLIESRGELSTVEARRLGIDRLPARVEELREQGVDVKTRMELPEGTTNRRKRYAVYYLTSTTP
jgi:hypothetical protein